MKITITEGHLQIIRVDARLWCSLSWWSRNRDRRIRSLPNTKSECDRLAVLFQIRKTPPPSVFPPLHMSAGAPPSVLHFPMDDPDLDDAELWAVIDTAAASRSRNPLLPLKNPNPHAFSPSPMGSKPFRNPRHLRVAGEMTRVPADGEVVQEAHWDHRRPHKMAKFVESGTVVDERRMVVVRHPQRPPVVAVSSPSYWSPDQARFMAKSRSPVVESPPPEGWKSEEKETMSHSLGGRFPSVSSFKHYQNTAMAVNSCFFLLALPYIEMF